MASASSFNIEYEKVPLGLLRRYLVAHGWRMRQASFRPATQIPQSVAARTIMEGRMSGERNYDIYTLPETSLTGIELLAPRSADSIDFVYQVSSAIRILSNIEDRSPEEIVRDIRLVGFDVVRSRIPDIMVHDDSIHLNVAASYINGARNLLAAAAMTEVEPEPYFLRVQPRATEYANHCRFGHTFKGSFGFVLESPLRPKQGVIFDDYEEPAPFERMVIQRLVRGVQSICTAVNTSNEKLVVEDVRHGFGANACEQLADLIEKTSSGGLIMSFTFSPEWAAPSEVRQQQDFRLGPRHVEVSRAAAKILRSNVISRPEKIFGRVIRLQTEANPSDIFNVKGTREIVIYWGSEDFGDILVNIALLAVDYLEAVEAHRLGRPVSVTGTLEREGRRWILRNPREFTFLV